MNWSWGTGSSEDQVGRNALEKPLDRQSGHHDDRPPFFGATIGDFNCGLRGFTREAFGRMDLRARGMELASEMVMKATVLGCGWRRFPRFSFRTGAASLPYAPVARRLEEPAHHAGLQPALAFLLSRSGGIARRRRALHPAPAWFVAHRCINLDVDTLPFAAAFILIGFQSIYSGSIPKSSPRRGLSTRPCPAAMARPIISLERSLAIGMGFFAIGFAGGLFALVSWAHHSFGLMDVERLLRIADPSALAMTWRANRFIQFFLSLLLMRKD